MSRVCARRTSARVWLRGRAQVRACCTPALARDCVRAAARSHSCDSVLTITHASCNVRKAAERATVEDDAVLEQKTRKARARTINKTTNQASMSA
eukprot:6211160-Pleurochrysis_carterae.AAC.2